MAYVAVKKNDQDAWEIVKYTSSIYGQTSLVSGVIVGDISRLDAAGRLEHGFWIVEDIYVGTGEFMEFQSKDVNMDDVNGKVINTYTYVRMDLAVIRDEMKNRVHSYRMQLANSLFEHDTHQIDISTEGRNELQGFVIETLLDPALESVTWRLQSGEDLVLTASEVKALYQTVAAFRKGLFVTEAELVTAIDGAQTYEDIREVSKWGDQYL